MDSARIIEALLTTVPYTKKASAGAEIVTRCPFCGDSAKHNDSTHLYISTGINEEPLLYNCKLCGGSGLLTSKILSDYFNIYDTEVLIELSKYNKEVLGYSKNKRFLDEKSYFLNNNFITECDLSAYKLSYINNRLGTNLTYKDILKKKIVLNLYDLFKCNNIPNLTRDKRIVDALNQHFLGFISKDNAFVTLRKVSNIELYHSINKRYINYSLFNKFSNKERFYIMPNTINYPCVERIKVHIAEGVFDILGVLYNINNGDEHQQIYAAICGAGYINMVKYILLDLKLFNMELHIYKDTDQSDKLMYDIKNLISIFNIPMYVHTNIFPNEKDFGVPKERINHVITKF